MKKLIAAICLGALGVTAATSANAQYGQQPVTPLDAIFSTLFGAPLTESRAPEPVYRPRLRAYNDRNGGTYDNGTYDESYDARAAYNDRRPARQARQGYDRNWQDDRRFGFEGRQVERRGFSWPSPFRQQRTARLEPQQQAVDPRYMRQTVAYQGNHTPGTIIVDTNDRLLYFVQENGTAIRYGIGVGREGFEWNGTASVERKAEWPAWHPPAEMREREPWLPERMEGGPENPLGARALYLFEGGKDTLYRIHGTNQPSTIGQAVSSGCIRMLNDDVADLYERVPMGAKVVVI